MTGEPGVTLESLDFGVGRRLHHLLRPRPVGRAAPRHPPVPHRADPGRAGHQDRADYAAHPVPREFGPPGTADYLSAPDEDDDLDEDGVPGRDRDRERLGLLAGLREVFPHWAISYSPFSRAWTARKDGATICQNSAALLCIALLLIEGRQRQARRGRRDWPPGSGG